MPRRFPPQVALAIDESKYLYIRAGTEHRFIPVWVVLVGDRVMIRSWNFNKSGWFPAFVKEKSGAVKVGNREIPVRASPVRGAKLLDAMDIAYGEKYTTKPNQQYVKGFATPRRRATTLELLPL